MSFYGDGFVRVPVGGVSTSHATLELHFRTWRRDALIFLAAGDSDYAAATLRAGAVVLRTDLGAGETVVAASSTPGRSFADHEWHYVNATWSHGRVHLSVDRVYARADDAPRPFTDLDVAGDVHIGGTATSSDAYLYAGDVASFRGCMHHVVFDRLDLLALAHHGEGGDGGGGGSSDGVTWGSCSPEFDAATDEPMSFVDEAAYVEFDAVPELRVGARLSFDVRTRSADAVLVYDSGPDVDSAAFLLVEIVDGRLKLRLGGERPVAVTSSVMLDDGQWHRVELEFAYGSVAVLVDGRRDWQPAELDGTRPVIERASRLFVGGVSETTRRYVMSRQLEFIADSRALAVSLVGCVRNLVVDRTTLSWPDVATSRHLRTGCVWTYPCQSEPCPHNSRCVEHGYDSYHCRCATQPCGVESEDPPSVTVEGPVRVRELIVEEGGRRTVGSEHIDILVDHVKAGVTNSRVVFTARKLPVRGVLFVSESRSPQTNAVSFSMSDLRQGRVTYFHDCSEDTTDSVAFELHFDVAFSMDDVAADFLRAYNFTLAIRILPVNDRPTLKLPANDTLVLIVNTHLRLTAKMLRAVDPDDSPENLEYVVDCSTNHSRQESGSYFTLSGDNVTSFSQADIDAGLVRLIQRGPRGQQLTLRVSDGKVTSDDYPLRVVGVDIRLRAVRNTGLVVQRSRSSVVITSDRLTFSCGAVHQNVDVRYELLSAPRHGEIERRQRDDDWTSVTTFTQRQIDDGRLRYRLRDAARTGPAMSERLTFRVGALTVRDTDQHTLNVSVVDSRVELVRSTGLRLRSGARQGVVTSSELSAVSSDRSDIVYRVVSTPRRGHLLLAGSPLRAADNFTQADLDAGRLAYRLQLALMMPVRDDFEFQLLTTHAQSDVALFELRYEPPSGDRIFINNGLFDVVEGNHKLIGLENIYVDSSNTSDYRYSVVEGPTHGELRIVEATSRDVLQYNATSFTNDDVRQQRLYYVHDDSETDQDSFRFFVAPASSRANDGQLFGQFDIAIVLRNDNPPRRVVDSTVSVVENRGRVLTTNDLLYEDPDVNFDSQHLVYTWQHIENGDIVAAYDRVSVVRRFTQKNLTSGELYFRHRGAAHASTEFTVSDGLFQVTAGSIDF